MQADQTGDQDGDVQLAHGCLEGCQVSRQRSHRRNIPVPERRQRDQAVIHENGQATDLHGREVNRVGRKLRKIERPWLEHLKQVKQECPGQTDQHIDTHRAIDDVSGHAGRAQHVEENRHCRKGQKEEAETVAEDGQPVGITAYEAHRPAMAGTARITAASSTLLLRCTS